MKNDYKEEVITFAKILDEKGMINAMEGNISAYDRENDLLYITPSAKRKSFLEPGMIAVLKNGKQIDGSLKRSSEYLLHEAALKCRPDCNAVVHSHSPFLTAYAYCNKPIKIDCSSSFSLAIGEIPCLPYGQPGTTEIFDGIEEALAKSDIVLLGNHGAVCVGKDLESCVRLYEAAEDIMKTYLIATMIGKPYDIPKDKLEALKNHPFSRYKK